MKKNETKYATMTADELGVRLRELQGKLLTLRTQTVTVKVEDPTAIGNTRRAITRVLTARRAQQLGIKHAPKGEKPPTRAKAPKTGAAPKAGKGASGAAGEKKTMTKRTTSKPASKSK